MKENNSKHQKKLTKKNILILITTITVCFVIVLIFIWKFKSNEDKWYKNLTNPFLDTNIWESLMKNKNINLEYYLDDYRISKINNWEITHLSVYFRNINNGGRFWIEEKELFSPASLMKLPLLLVYFKKSESEPGFLDKKVIFTKNWTSDQYRQNILPKNRLQTWNEYRIIDIINQMIKYSDNEASIFLENNISIDEFKKVFTDIWIEFPPFVDWLFDNNIRVIDYSAFFRVLFNASYLNREHSEKVLDLLTKTEFEDWLVAWISDRDITISHKFGERSIWGVNWIERMQLHDCWIVYYPNHPYILCIMTRWYNWNKLKEILQEVSSIVYQEIDEAYSK